MFLFVLLERNSKLLFILRRTVIHLQDKFRVVEKEVPLLSEPRDENQHLKQTVVWAAARTFSSISYLGVDTYIFGVFVFLA